MIRSLLSCLLLLALLAPELARAEQASPAQLRALRERIQALQETQRKDLRERDALAAELRERELAISALEREQVQLAASARQAARELEQLRERQRRMAAEQTTQINWLTRTVRASYFSGREPTLKLLLSQEQPDQLARLMRYHEYVQRARTERLATLEQELSALLALSLEVAAARDRHDSRRNAVAAQQQRLENARREREQALAKLNARVTDQGSRLTSLQADAERLDKLLQEMNRAISDIPADLGGAPFGQMAGKLPWPLEGRHRVSFGARRDGGLRWNGVLLEARESTPVRAIHPGRVVYADWLRGYGMMLIVDHGNGYLSLYGHNQSLMRDVGDWVAAGDVLARAGNSGGSGIPGLYFEIRREGRPVDPARWCNQRVTLPPLAER